MSTERIKESPKAQVEPPDDQESLTAREPVMVGAAVVSLLEATLSVLLVFDIITLTSEQYGALHAFIAAVVVVVGVIVRNLVTPVSAPRTSTGRRATIVAR